MRKRLVNLIIECEIDDERKIPSGDEDKVWIKVIPRSAYLVHKSKILWEARDPELHHENDKKECER